MLLAWKFKKVTQRSTSNLAKILMSWTSLPVQLQHDTGKFWGNIIFTRSCKMLPFEHDLVQKVKKVRQRVCIKLVCDFDVENKVTTWCIQLLRTYHVHKTTLPWASLKIHKGHTKVIVKLVQDFDVENIPINLQHYIYEQLLHSQGSGCGLSTIRLPAQATTIPSSLRGLRGKKVSCFQTSRPFLCVKHKNWWDFMKMEDHGGPALILMKGHKP